MSQVETRLVAAPFVIKRGTTRRGWLRTVREWLAAEMRRSQDRYVLAMIPTEVGRETGARC